jgi:hypothetical protein
LQEKIDNDARGEN